MQEIRIRDFFLKSEVKITLECNDTGLDANTPDMVRDKDLWNLKILPVELGHVAGGVHIAPCCMYSVLDCKALGVQNETRCTHSGYPFRSGQVVLALNILAVAVHCTYVCPLYTLISILQKTGKHRGLESKDKISVRLTGNCLPGIQSAREWGLAPSVREKQLLSSLPNAPSATLSRSLLQIVSLWITAPLIGTSWLMIKSFNAAMNFPLLPVGHTAPVALSSLALKVIPTPLASVDPTIDDGESSWKSKTRTLIDLMKEEMR
ncbi:hypothetical protein C8R45DRAFT_946114 [Mycena sanguinolenta]|nr:hypothetical protein C8R45DRAFT_946114 [Mycena sanguinolenta]